MFTHSSASRPSRVTTRGPSGRNRSSSSSMATNTRASRVGAAGMAVLRVRGESYLMGAVYAPDGVRVMLDGKTALVTGSSQGIGFGVARAFAASGASVVLTSERPRRELPAVEQLLAEYPACSYVEADLTLDGEPERLAAEAWAAL